MTATLFFAEQEFHAAGDRALYWPAQKCLLLSDLHLEKGSSFAENSGQMLPPYDSAATLQNLRDLVAHHAPRRIVCLGDNFHDGGGEGRLTGQAAEMLMQLTAQTEWHWIVGNHDPDLGCSWGGTIHRELEMGAIMLRHEIDASDGRPEISGHYHPKFRIRIRGRAMSRACFIISGGRMVMPAFGALTGGMDASQIAPLMPDDGRGHGGVAAWVAAGEKFARFAVQGSG